MGSNTTSHLLPKNRGVLPNSSELAGCPVMSYANTILKKEAVGPGSVVGCVLPCERVLGGSAKSCNVFPTFPRFIDSHFLSRSTAVSLGALLKGPPPSQHRTHHL